MTSNRKARRRFARWVRYFRKYEPWHYATPGMERAYGGTIRGEHSARRRRKP